MKWVLILFFQVIKNNFILLYNFYSGITTNYIHLVSKIKKGKSLKMETIEEETPFILYNHSDDIDSHF